MVVFSAAAYQFHSFKFIDANYWLCATLLSIYYYMQASLLEIRIYSYMQKSIYCYILPNYFLSGFSRSASLFRANRH